MFTHAYTSCCSELLSDFEGDTDTVLDPLPAVLRWVARGHRGLWDTNSEGTTERFGFLLWSCGPLPPINLSDRQPCRVGGAGGWGGQGEGVAYIVKPGR